MPPSWNPVPACVRHGHSAGGPSYSQLRWCCRRAVLSCSSDDAASIPKSGLEIKNRCTKEGVNGEKLASIPKSGLEIKNRCTQEGVNRQNLASIPKSGPEITNHCTQEGVNRQNLASIPKFDPEIKNQCTKEGVNRQNLASIRKSEPEIKNRCMQEGVNREILASIPKSGLEIKNRCSRGVVAVCRRNHSPLPLRKLESDAENRCRKQHPPKSRHAQRSAATKTNTKNSIFVNPGLTLGRVPKMRSRKGI